MLVDLWFFIPTSERQNNSITLINPIIFDDEKMIKILIIGPSWVGDMVMSQSLYIQLSEQYPTAKIDVLAPAWCRPILERMPQINRAIEMPVGHGELKLSARWTLAKTLQQENYTLAFILPNSAKAALIPFFARIPTRTGWKGEMRYGLLNDLRPDKTVFPFMVERYVALAHTKKTMQSDVSLEHIAFPQLTIDVENQQKNLARFGIYPELPIVGLCPGAEFGPAKRWPDEHYATIANQLIEQGNQICLFGGPKDAETTLKIHQALPAEKQEYCFDLAGKTALNDAVDLLAACHTVISNDSGLMHVAAAVNAKIIAIYGSSSPKYTPPLTKTLKVVNTDISCRPCFKRECPLQHLRCLKELEPSVVMKAYTELQNTIT